MVKTVYEPATAAELAEVVRSVSALRLVAPDPFRVDPFRGEAVGDDPAHLSLDWLCGIVEHQAADQIVVVRAGTRIADLNAALAKSGQCIPILPISDDHAFSSVDWLMSPERQMVGHAASMALPHALEAQCGGWRDWVIGMTVVLADGDLAKCGSKVVKNVAGYDVQKLFLGARGTLCVAAELILRTFPRRALPATEVEVHIREKVPVSEPIWLQRTLPTDFATAVRNAGEAVVALDRATSTIWARVPSGQSLPRFPGDWYLRSACGPANLPLSDPTQVRLMRRAKSLFDPTNKLNPGEMVIF